MNTYKIIPLFALTALLLAGCQREMDRALSTDGTSIPVQLEQPVFVGDGAQAHTKADMDGVSGVCTWTDGDQMGLWVSGTFRPGSVEATYSRVYLDTPLAAGEHVTGYAIYPYAMCNDGSVPTLRYLSEYDMTDMDLTDPDYCPYVPLMAEGNDNILRFYHVGALLRLALSNVPENTNKIRVTFMGITYVTGRARVSNAGSAYANTTITSGSGNYVTFVNVTRSASTQYLNIPLPNQPYPEDYTGLTTIRVEAMQGTNVLLSLDKEVNPSWRSMEHAFGRVFEVDLADVSISSSPATLWRGESRTYAAAANAGSGLSWCISESDTNPGVATSVASIGASSGEITALSAGTAYVYAKVGEVYSRPVPVYVNDITGVYFSPSSALVGIGRTIPLTAFIEHTTNGTIVGYPEDISFASGNAEWIRIHDAFEITPYMFGTAKASGTVDGIRASEDPYTGIITATIPAAVSSTGSEQIASCDILCSPFSINHASGYTCDGTMSGKYISRGILEKTANTLNLTLTDGSDIFELLRYYNNRGGVGEDCTPTQGEATGVRHYFDYLELGNYFGGNGLDGTEFTVLSGNISNTHSLSYGTDSYHVPTKDEWGTTLDAARGGAQFGSGDPVLYCRVLVDLSNAIPAYGAAWDYSSMGLNGNTWDSVGTGYISGLLLFPDHAVVTWPGYVPLDPEDPRSEYRYQNISATDLMILCQGPSGNYSDGCVFLPCVVGGEQSAVSVPNIGLYASASEASRQNALFFRNNVGVSINNLAAYDKEWVFSPVRLFRD